MKLFGGEKSLKFNSEDPDIQISNIGVFVEVKAAGGDRFIIYEKQLDTHLSWAEQGRYFYLLFYYRNKKKDNGKVIRLLSRNTPTSESLDKFLASNTLTAYLIDIAVLDAIRRLNGTIKFNRARFPEKDAADIVDVLVVTRGILDCLVENPEPLLGRLNLDPLKYCISKGSVAVEFRDAKMVFELARVVPRRARGMVKRSLLFQISKGGEVPIFASV